MSTDQSFHSYVASTFGTDWKRIAFASHQNSKQSTVGTFLINSSNHIHPVYVIICSVFTVYKLMIAGLISNKIFLSACGYPSTKIRWLRTFQRFEHWHNKYNLRLQTVIHGTFEPRHSEVMEVWDGNCNQVNPNKLIWINGYEGPRKLWAIQQPAVGLF